MQNDWKKKRRIASRQGIRLKTRKLGSNLSKTFENHLKQLVV
jgi:hypothetical protein